MNQPAFQKTTFKPVDSLESNTTLRPPQLLRANMAVDVAFRAWQNGRILHEPPKPCDFTLVAYRLLIISDNCRITSGVIYDPNNCFFFNMSTWRENLGCLSSWLL